MADFVRRLVSGNKARFKDGELDLELDLAYITDQVIVMGYPATGIEGLYRNRREDAKKFLDHHHKKNYWVFNFCPIGENSYPPEVFEGRVSRYPFPDHHAPPLSILPLVAREIRAWLDGSPERVAVLHCKAGKGRSGTMACAYLLSLASPQTPLSLGRSRSVHEQAKARAEALMNEMPEDETINAELQTARSDSLDEDPIKHELSTGQASPPDAEKQARHDNQDSQESVKSQMKSDATGSSGSTNANTLEGVLNLHTSKRMKRPSSPSAKVKQGVSIPSQRRWLYYWSILLARQGPPGFWALNPTECLPAQKVRLTQITLRMRDMSGVKSGLFKAANMIINGTIGSGKSPVWASVARYDDELVESLERWERQTRSSDGNMGKRRVDSERMDNAFTSGKWDSGKMVRTFAQLGGTRYEESQTEAAEKIVTHVLRPLPHDNWNTVRHKVNESEKAGVTDESVVDSEEASINDTTRTPDATNGIVLNADREVRVKLYMGRVFMGWLWFIPRFHMGDGSVSTLRLTRKEIDFPVGYGSWIVDLDLCMERCAEDAGVTPPPARQSSTESREGKGELGGLPAALEAAVLGQVDKAMEARASGKK